MSRYNGLLDRPGVPPAEVLVEATNGKFTIVESHGRWVGSWHVDEAGFEHLTAWEFTFVVGDETWRFAPNNPSAFAEAIDLVIDLRSKSRFGLAERLRKVREEERTGGRGSAPG